MTSTLHDALSAEHETTIVLEYLLLGDLQELLLEPPTPSTRQALLVLLGALLDGFSHDLDAETGEHGLSAALFECPQWFREIESVRGDELTHYLRLEELRHYVEQDRDFGRIAQEVSRDLREWMQSLASVRREGTRLVQMAANRDVGGES